MGEPARAAAPPRREGRGPGRAALRRAFRRWLGALAGLYAALLVASHLARAARGEPPLPPGVQALEVPARAGIERAPGVVSIAYRDVGAGGTPFVLLHGSPGWGRDFRGVQDALGRRTIVPDLPGFGASSDAPDLSIRAHAAYALDLLRRLGIERAHVVGYSMGGAVAIEMTRQDPAAVRSLVLLSATGVQELELLGDHALNHALHAVGLVLAWALEEGFPHFGLLDHSPLTGFARNFHDSDQRPLRAALEAWVGPTLVLHGRRDVLVPVEAAREHARLVPQSELVLLDGGHLLVFQRGALVARHLAEFADRVEAGEAPRRAQADPARLRGAREPFDAAGVPPWQGVALLAVVVLLALATLVSEDLTCIAAGALVAEGRLGLLAASLGCTLGIYVGDLLLFLAGRTLGRAAVVRWPLRWFLDEEAVDRGSRWFAERGLRVIFLSRFFPGLRLPTYFAAGLLRTSVLRFALYFGLAALVWTPTLVFVSSVAGRRVAALFEWAGTRPLAWVLPVLLLFAVWRVLLPLSTHRGRRLARGALRRWTRWEYWPRWVVYPPVVLAVLWHAARRGSPTIFTAANPGIPGGGVVGESKAAILEGLAGAGEAVPRWRLLPPGGEARAAAARAAMEELGLGFPVVLKPDVGERGRDVRIVRGAQELAPALEAHPEATLLQEYVPGPEFGVFYARRPGEPRGRVISCARKRLPRVVGDGERTLGRLVLDDEREVALLRTHRRANLERWDDVPAAGEVVFLGDLGTHCRGAAFLDGSDLVTPELEREVDRLARTFDGFFFGRFDLRAPSEDDLRAGRGLRILELNGVASEVAHVYDPAVPYLAGLRALLAQWRLAVEIGAANRARGARPEPLGRFLRRVLA